MDSRGLAVQTILPFYTCRGSCKDAWEYLQNVKNLDLYIVHRILRSRESALLLQLGLQNNVFLNSQGFDSTSPHPNDPLVWEVQQNLTFLRSIYSVQPHDNVLLTDTPLYLLLSGRLSLGGALLSFED